MKKGRDNCFKCSICGKYISYDDIPDKVGSEYTPDSEYTVEKFEYWHKKCENGKETKLGENKTVTG